jgi:hypothetical protein
MGADLVLSGLLSKFLTDVIKWLANKGQMAIPAIGNKIVAFILSALATYFGRLHLPIDLGSLQALQPLLTSVIVAGLSYALHDLLDWLAQVAGNLPPKPVPAQPAPGSPTAH